MLQIEECKFSGVTSSTGKIQGKVSGIISYIRSQQQFKRHSSGATLASTKPGSMDLHMFHLVESSVRLMADRIMPKRSLNSASIRDMFMEAIIPVESAVQFREALRFSSAIIPVQ